MKKIVYILALGMMMTSCRDFFEVPSQNQLAIDNFYQTPTQIDQALVGVYGCLKPFSKYYFGMSEMRSDNMFEISEAKQYDISDCAQFNTSSLLTNNYVKNCWCDHYKLIAAANVLLDHLDGVEFKTEQTREQYEAETRFLRALAYFDMVRFFGRVPVSLKTLTPTESFELGQSEIKDVYEQAILPDLRYAVSHLAEQAVDHNGTLHAERVKRIAAQALLGKVYMQMAGYPLYTAGAKDSARVALEPVVAQAGLYFAANMEEWNNQWIHENDNHYFLFEIQYACADNQGNPMTPLSRTSNTKSDEYCGANLTTGQHFYIERDLQDEMMQGEIDSLTGNLNPTDQRFRWTINMALVYDEETGTYVGGATDANNILVKFFEHKMKRASLGYSDMDATLVNYTYWPQNFPVLRVEDAMLLYAECVGAAEGLEYLNAIRTRAGLAEYTAMSEEDFQEAVSRERQFELLGEGHRWFDQVRHNTYVADSKRKFNRYRDYRDSSHSGSYTIYANRVTTESALYPIPLSQMQVREGLYQQNPGY